LNTAQPIAPQVMVLGAVYIAIAIAVDATYVLAAAAVSRRFMRSPVAQGPHGSSRGRDLCRAWARGGGDRRQEAVGIA